MEELFFDLLNDEWIEVDNVCEVPILTQSGRKALAIDPKGGPVIIPFGVAIPLSDRIRRNISLLRVLFPNALTLSLEAYGMKQLPP